LRFAFRLTGEYNFCLEFLRTLFDIFKCDAVDSEDEEWLPDAAMEGGRSSSEDEDSADSDFDLPVTSRSNLAVSQHSSEFGDFGFMEHMTDFCNVCKN